MLPSGKPAHCANCRATREVNSRFLSLSDSSGACTDEKSDREKELSAEACLDVTPKRQCVYGEPIDSTGRGMVSEEFRKRFKKQVQSGWKQRAIAAGTSQRSSRAASFQEGIAKVLAANAEAGKKMNWREIRRAIVLTTSVFSCKLYAGIMKKDFQQQKELCKALIEHSARYDEEKEDLETYQRRVTCLFEIDDVEYSQYLSEIIAGVDENFVCRRKDCLKFCNNRG